MNSETVTICSMTGLSLHLPTDGGVFRRVIAQATVREILMGAQDNLTNVLAVVLGVTIGAGRADFVALAGLSAGIAESVSMGGVLYNATRAEQLAAHTGTGTEPAKTRLSPALSGVVTAVSSLLAGLIPLAPFTLLPVSSAIVVSMVCSLSGLFVLGSITGRVAGGTWLVEGLRLVAVAGVAALAAALVGSVLHVA
jgi:VIT1/CCC1 family predicted Fe2+/Mn2+ transporter